MIKEIRTHVQDFDDVRRALEQVNNILVSGGTVNEIQRVGVRIGDADIRILDFDKHFLIVESPDRDVDIALRFATDSLTGVSSYTAADFGVVAGAVSLDDSVVKSVASDGSSITPSGKSFSILGGTGISTSGSGSSITIINDSPNVDQNLFSTINCPSGTDPVADSTTDTLNLTSANAHLTITGNSGTDTVDFAVVTGTSGASLVLANGANTWSANQILSGVVEQQFDTSINYIRAVTGVIPLDHVVLNAKATLDLGINGTFKVRLTSSGLDVVDLMTAQNVTIESMTLGSMLFAGTAGAVTQDNSNLFWDDTNNRLGIGINSGMPAQTGLSVSGHVDLLHTSVDNDDHALGMDIDAAGFGDVRALDIEYETGAISSGEDEAVILVDINEFDATGGEVYGLEVLATDGGADAIYGIKVGAVVAPILQDSGDFANPTTGTNDTPSTDVPAMIDGSEGTNTTIFVADDDYILIGAAAAFTEIEFDIETPAANPGIKPTFAYSISGSHQFTTFSPVDGTNGFRNSGVIAWDAADLTSHTTNDDTGTFDIKITRTHAAAGSVSLFFAKTAATVVYKWDKDGNIISRTYESNITTGTAPLTVASATVVPNLNASLLEGNAASAFASVSHTHLTVSTAEVFSGTSPTSMTNLDLSATVGSNVALVALSFKSAGSMDTLAVRTDGDTNTYYDALSASRAYGVQLGHHDRQADLVLIVATSSSGIIEWQTETAQTCTVDVLWFIA